MQQAVDAAQVHEGAVVGDVLHHAVDDLTLGQALDQARALLGAGLFQHGAARDDDVAALAVHLQDLERLRDIHQRRDVTHRTDVDLRARQKGHGAVQVDGEAALHAAEDHALDARGLGEFGLQLVPCGFAACAVARQHRFAMHVFHAVDIDFDFVTDLEIGLLTRRRREFAQRHAAFALQADVNDGEVILDAGDGAEHHAALEAVGAAEHVIEHCREIVTRGIWLCGHKNGLS